MQPPRGLLRQEVFVAGVLTCRHGNKRRRRVHINSPLPARQGGTTFSPLRRWEPAGRSELVAARSPPAPAAGRDVTWGRKGKDDGRVEKTKRIHPNGHGLHRKWKTERIKFPPVW